jgi:hypothetical protein
MTKSPLGGTGSWAAIGRSEPGRFRLSSPTMPSLRLSLAENFFKADAA